MISRHEQRHGIEAGYERQQNQRALEGDSRIPKKAADKKFQIQNNLAPDSSVL